MLSIQYTQYGSFPKIGGPQHRPQNTIILITGIPKKVPLILGNHPHKSAGDSSAATITFSFADALADPAVPP